MSKSTRGIRVAGIASLAVSLSVGVAAPAFAAAGFEFTRVAGDDRYETAVEAAEIYGASDDVILANGQPGEYADALAGNYLAGAEDAPILLTKRSGLPAVTKAQIDDIDPAKIWVVGGEAAVPADQVAALEADGYDVERIAGDDRFGTNAKVIAADGPAKGGVGLIATGLNFPDALAAGPFAYQGHSLGLVRTNTVPDVVGDALEADGVTKVLIFGGTDVVGAGVVSDLAARGITVEQRFAGSDRSETSELAAEYAVSKLNFTDEHVGVASGYTDGFGADALAGGPVEGNELSPMLITRNVDNPDDVIDYLENHSDTLADGHIYGGTAAISAAAEAAMKTAATGTAPASATARPELVSAKVVDTNTAGELGANGTTVEYTFDEAIQTATGGTAPVPGEFFVYNQAGLVDAGDGLVSVSGNTVRIFFNAATLDTDAEAAALTVATVDDAAVEDLSGAKNPEGDAALGTTTGGGTTPLPAGATEAPDLTGVGNFAAVTGGGTDVEFTFDEAASVVTATGFSLVLADGTVYESDSVEADDATTVIVRFSENITRTDVVRGFVDQDAVTEFSDNEADGADDNELQAADVNNSGNSDDPDLVSIELREGSTTGGDQVLFTFDENIATVNDPSFFQLYTTAAEGVADGDGATINPSNARQVLVDFAENEINNVVGGSVLEGAVTGTDGNDNRDDEVGVANTGSTSGRTAGRTDGPDLTAVAVAKETDAFGNTTGTDVTYTFDEALTGIPTAAGFHLYLANGDALTTTTCVVGNSGTAADVTDDTTVVCEFATADIAATLGTVDAGVVTAQDGAPSNPEGAEFTTGGTGTPAS